ncbi:hypothetical protein TNIN_337431 [Trichonephila inaurata madagascariensis]|uniref:Uncharacterized protein n=1 Tax=Trichonephila inaurata madagascariensis TaxID=2747483 RepID=A0A8X6XBY3_9ARAC|nr:hypothetical protein TNIN_337431 [Trichonephila inaurata madagascariensis]
MRISSYALGYPESSCDFRRRYQKLGDIDGRSIWILVTNSTPDRNTHNIDPLIVFPLRRVFKIERGNDSGLKPGWGCSEDRDKLKSMDEGVLKKGSTCGHFKEKRGCICPSSRWEKGFPG